MRMMPCPCPQILEMATWPRTSPVAIQSRTAKLSMACISDEVQLLDETCTLMLRAGSPLKLHIAALKFIPRFVYMRRICKQFTSESFLKLFFPAAM